jgi:hypothetical protein
MKINLTPLLLGASLLAAVSCGSNNDDNDNSAQQQQDQEDSGTYAVTLRTINPGKDGNNATGVGSISISGNQISVKVAMAATPGNTFHMQSISGGGSCPGSSEDTNNDGFIDMIEGTASYGGILIPLDGNLDTQAAGANGFPSANNLGIYSYNGSGNFTNLVEDLRQPDADETDQLIKLGASENLNLAGKQLVVYGVSNNANLPATVAAMSGSTAKASLPIACGQITRVTTGSDDGGTSTGGSSGNTTGGTTAGSFVE